MSYEPPEPLTPRGVFRDVLVSLVLVLGTALIEFLLSKLEQPPAHLVATLRMMETALVCFAAGYCFKAITYAWLELSLLVDAVANSAAWQMLARATRFLCTVISWLLRIALGGAIGIGVLILVGAVVSYFFPEEGDLGLSHLSPPRYEGFSPTLALAAAVASALTVVSYWLAHTLSRRRGARSARSSARL